MFNKKEYMKQYRLDHRDRIKESRKQYYKNNREEALEYDKKYREDNAELCKEQRKKHYQKNREREKEYSRIYRKNNPEKIKQYEKDNCEMRKGHHRKYRKTENGRANIQKSNSKRQARKRALINTLTAREWEDILEKYNYRCVYCDVEFNCELLPTRDHIIPLLEGGHNIKENIVPACQSCNSKKGIKSFDDFSSKCEEFIGL